MKAQSELDLVTALKATKYAPVAEKLQKEFNAAGITSIGSLHNAPLKVRTTHGADIYEVMRILGNHVVEDDEEKVKGTSHISPLGTPANPKKVEGTINVMPLVSPTNPKEGRK